MNDKFKNFSGNDWVQEKINERLMEGKEVKHTKGPWIADGNGFEKSYNISNDKKSICDVKVSRADATLIAAAPEMLQALQEILEALDFDHGDQRTSGRACAMMPQIHFLIKKAKGE